MSAAAAPIAPPRAASPAPAIPVRPFTPDDYPALVAVTNAVHPDYPETVEEMRYNDETRDPKCRWARWLAEADDGSAVGVGEYSQHEGMYHPRKFDLAVNVLPECEGRGIGSRLFETVVHALAPFDPITLRGEVREDRARGLEFARDRGFAEGMREWESRLNVPTFDFAPFAGAEERVRDEGIVLKTMADLLAADGPAATYRKLFDLEWELS